jgi:hypothetical protein
MSYRTKCIIWKCYGVIVSVCLSVRSYIASSKLLNGFLLNLVGIWGCTIKVVERISFCCVSVKMRLKINFMMFLKISWWCKRLIHGNIKYKPQLSSEIFSMRCSPTLNEMQRKILSGTHFYCNSGFLFVIDEHQGQWNMNDRKERIWKICVGYVFSMWINCFRPVYFQYIQRKYKSLATLPTSFHYAINTDRYLFWSMKMGCFSYFLRLSIPSVIPSLP